MKTFENPIAPKERKSGKDFVCPTRDQATTGRFMAAGDNYGLGFRNPVGGDRVKSYSSGPIPMKSKCFDSEK